MTSPRRTRARSMGRSGPKRGKEEQFLPAKRVLSPKSPSRTRLVEATSPAKRKLRRQTLMPMQPQATAHLTIASPPTNQRRTRRQSLMPLKQKTSPLPALKKSPSLGRKKGAEEEDSDCVVVLHLTNSTHLPPRLTRAATRSQPVFQSKRKMELESADEAVMSIKKRRIIPPSKSSSHVKAKAPPKAEAVSPSPARKHKSLSSLPVTQNTRGTKAASVAAPKHGRKLVSPQASSQKKKPSPQKAIPSAKQRSSRVLRKASPDVMIVEVSPPPKKNKSPSQGRALSPNLRKINAMVTHKVPSPALIKSPTPILKKSPIPSRKKPLSPIQKSITPAHKQPVTPSIKKSRTRTSEKTQSLDVKKPRDTPTPAPSRKVSNTPRPKKTPALTHNTTVTPSPKLLRVTRGSIKRLKRVRLEAGSPTTSLPSFRKTPSSKKRSSPRTLLSDHGASPVLVSAQLQLEDIRRAVSSNYKLKNGHVKSHSPAPTPSSSTRRPVKQNLDTGTTKADVHVVGDNKCAGTPLFRNHYDSSPWKLSTSTSQPIFSPTPRSSYHALTSQQTNRKVADSNRVVLSHHIHTSNAPLPDDCLTNPILKDSTKEKKDSNCSVSFEDDSEEENEGESRTAEVEEDSVDGNVEEGDDTGGEQDEAEEDTAEEDEEEEEENKETKVPSRKSYCHIM